MDIQLKLITWTSDYMKGIIKVNYVHYMSDFISSGYHVCAVNGFHYRNMP